MACVRTGRLAGEIGRPASECATPARGNVGLQPDRRLACLVHTSAPAMREPSSPSAETLRRIRVQQTSKQASDALSSLGEVELLGAVLAGVPDGIVITTASSRILWANPAYCAMTGYSLDELIGETPRRVRDDGGASAEAIWDALGSCGFFDGRVTNRRADGSTYHASLSIVRLPGEPSGVRSRAMPEPAHFLGIMRDVTADVLAEERLAELRRRADSARDTTITALATLAEQRDDCTGGHLARVEAYCRAMAVRILEVAPESLPVWARDAELLARCSVLHDIGKVGIPDAILQKPGPLDPEQQDVMRSHPDIGARIIERLLELQPDSEFLRVARDVVLCHHERFDGEGYPRGLVGKDVPMAAQLTTAADVLDALTTIRPYKPAHRFEDAIDWLVRQRGRMLDPVVVDALLAVSPELSRIHRALAPDVATGEPIRPSGLRRSEPARPRASDSPPPPSMMDGGVLSALRGAARSSRTGLLSIREGGSGSHVYLEEGRIVWIHTEADPGSIPRLLIEEHGIPAQLVQTATATCKQTGASLGDVLVDMAAMDPSVLREVLRARLGDRLRGLLATPGPTAAFVPRAPAQAASRFAFTIDELLVSSCPKEKSP